MNRRTILAGAAFTLSTSFAGCVGDTTQTASAPTEIVKSDFETGVDTDVSWEDGPEIMVAPDDSKVTVEGVGQYSSSSCGYLDNHEPSYDPEDAELSVVVTAEQDRSDDEHDCEDDLAASSYRFVIQFDEGIPRKIEAEHPFEESSIKEL